MKTDEISEQQEQNNGPVKPGRKRFTKKTVCWFLTAALVVLAALFFFADYLLYRTPDYNELLTRAKLAQLPESTKNLQVETRPYMRNRRAVSNKGELYMRFQAEPNDIVSFVNNSPCIDTNRFRPLNQSVNSSSNPPWWIINQSASGRIYTFSELNDGLNFVAVIVDEDSDTVLISMCFVINPQLREMQNAFGKFGNNFDDFLDDLLHESLDIIGF